MRRPDRAVRESVANAMSDWLALYVMQRDVLTVTTKRSCIRVKQPGQKGTSLMLETVGTYFNRHQPAVQYVSCDTFSLYLASNRLQAASVKFVLFFSLMLRLTCASAAPLFGVGWMRLLTVL